MTKLYNACGTNPKKTLHEGRVGGQQTMEEAGVDNAVIRRVCE